MNKTILSMSLLIAFLIGCVTTQMASQFVVPPVKAGTNPQKWEYKCFNERSSYNIKEIEDKSNQLGKSGWEMVSAGSGEYPAICFKGALP